MNVDAILHYNNPTDFSEFTFQSINKVNEMSMPTFFLQNSLSFQCKNLNEDLNVCSASSK